MANGAITEGQVTASTEWDKVTHAAMFGRLFYNSRAAAWISRLNNVNQWLQIDLISPHTKVTRVATQGRSASSFCCQWVAKYNMQYSTNGVIFQYYKEQGHNNTKVKSCIFL